MRHTCAHCNGVRPETCAYNSEAYGVKIPLLRKFGLHASADALVARMTCRTCAHLVSDARDEPCATCRDFGKWEEADRPAGTAGVAPSDGGKR